MNYVASISGGKCSTAMVLRMLEEKMPLDELVYFDSGWEFPIMKKMVNRLHKETGIKLTVLKPNPSFEDLLYKMPIIRKKGPEKGKVHRYGHGWPAHNRRWHDREMVNIINRHCGHSIQYIGYPFERREKAKTKITSTSPLLEGGFDRRKTFEEVVDLKKKKNTRYPLVEWGMDIRQCLSYCKKHGFDYGDFYNERDRAGMFCCPLQSMKSIRLLRKEYPELWAYMLELDKKIEPNYGFNHGHTVNELEERFLQEEAKIKKLITGGLL